MSQGTIERNIVYMCNIHSKQLKKGDKDYSHIDETIQINLNNFRCNGEVRENYYLRNKKGKILSKKLRIDMVKAKRNGNKNMLKKNIDVNTISEISGMIVEEINSIK